MLMICNVCLKWDSPMDTSLEKLHLKNTAIKNANPADRDWV